MTTRLDPPDLPAKPAPRECLSRARSARPPQGLTGASGVLQSPGSGALKARCRGPARCSSSSAWSWLHHGIPAQTHVELIGTRWLEPLVSEQAVAGCDEKLRPVLARKPNKRRTITAKPCSCINCSGRSPYTAIRRRLNPRPLNDASALATATAMRQRQRGSGKGDSPRARRAGCKHQISNKVSCGWRHTSRRTSNALVRVKAPV